MDLTCYLHPSWRPMIRPARARRDWMDKTPESFAYRCLPLDIANAHGWEILNPYTFDACWNGQTDTSGVTIRLAPDTPPEGGAVSLFGQGIVTFHIPALFRTSPGWNLWIGGSPNEPKDGIYPLTGVVETDWSPFTFTMNWKFTRPDQWIRFEAGEPMCFVFPVQRACLEDIKPVMMPLDENPKLAMRFQEWSQERDAFVHRMATEPPLNSADKWQKKYYQGTDTRGEKHIEDHRTRLRLQSFDTSTIPWALTDPGVVAGSKASRSTADRDSVSEAIKAKNAPASSSPSSLHLRKREWLLDTLEQQRSLLPQNTTMDRRSGLTRDEFLERYYAANRPVILTGEMSDWRALTKWTPDYLKSAVGPAMIEVQGARDESDRSESREDDHRRQLRFDQFIDRATKLGSGHDVYLTACDSAQNIKALEKLHADVEFLDRFLTRDVEHPDGMMWIEPADTFIPLRHDLTNSFMAQIVGRKRLLILPPSEVAKLYNHVHVFSEIADLEDPSLTQAKFPLLENARICEVTLMPGEIMFMPVAWWHQVRSIDFSITITFTNFLWPNDAHKTFPTA